MCTSQIKDQIMSRRGVKGLSSGGYEGGALFATKAMSLPGRFRRRIARLPTDFVLDESGAI